MPAKGAFTVEVIGRKFSGSRGQLISVRHPHRNIITYVLKESVDAIHLSRTPFYFQRCMTIFSLLPGQHIPAEMPCYFLQSVTYAENWNAQFENCWIDMRGVCLINRIRPTRK